MNKINSFALIAALTISVTLAGCTKSKKVRIELTAVERQKLNLPSPDQVLQNPIYWMALAKNAPPGQKGSIEYFWQQMEKQGATTGLAISPGDFHKLSSNNARLRKFILQQQAIIKAYKEYYNENNK